jgi:hypothetical protein
MYRYAAEKPPAPPPQNTADAADDEAGLLYTLT